MLAGSEGTHQTRFVLGPPGEINSRCLLLWKYMTDYYTTLLLCSGVRCCTNCDSLRNNAITFKACYTPPCTRVVARA